MGRAAFTPEELPSGSGGGVTSSRVVSEPYVLLEELLTAKCSEWPAGISPEGGLCFVLGSTSVPERQRGAHHLGCKTEAWQAFPVWHSCGEKLPEHWEFRGGNR